MKNQFKILAIAAILLLTLAVCVVSAIGVNTVLGAANAAPMSLAAIAVLFRPNPTPPPFVPPTPPSQPRYLTFTAQEANSAVGFLLYNEFENPETEFEVNLQYSLNNGETWEEYAAIHSTDPTDTEFILLENVGDKVLFKGNNIYVSEANVINDDGVYLECHIEGSVSASGDITSLLNEIGGDVELTPCAFFGLFRGCEGLRQAPSLPSLQISEYCYYAMFQNCSHLVTAPLLPALIMADGCYGFMFSSCTDLYESLGIFATTLASFCFNSMFFKCTSLVTAPDLLAPILVSYCYSSMFTSCSSLANVKCLAVDISATKCTNLWLNSVSPNGTFVKAGSMQDWQSGDNGIPNGWTVQDAN